MAIQNLSISYPDFKLHELINPEEFDINNSEIQGKINSVLDVLNQITDNKVVTNADGTTTTYYGAEKVSLKAISPFLSTKLQAFLEEVVTRLKSTTDGTSGADLIASTTITGVTGNTVQAQLESIKAIFDSLQTEVTNNKAAYDNHRTSAIIDHPDGSVTTAKIANLGVTTTKLSDFSVTTAKLSDLGVTTAKLANLGVTTAKLSDGSVANAKISNGAVNLAKMNVADVDTRYYTKTALDGGSLDTRYYTEAEIDNKLGSANGGESTSIRDDISFPTTTDSHVLWRSDTKKFYIADGVSWVEYAKQGDLNNTNKKLTDIEIFSMWGGL